MPNSDATSETAMMNDRPVTTDGASVKIRMAHAPTISAAATMTIDARPAP